MPALRKAGAVLALCCAAVLAGGVVVEWAAGPAPMAADEAAAFAARSLEELGLEQVRLDPAVQEGTYRPASGDGEVRVWEVRSRVDGGSVTLLVHRDAGEAVRVEDVADDGGPLLTDAQFERLDGLTAGVEREFRREAWVATIAGGAGTAVALAVAAAARRS